MEALVVGIAALIALVIIDAGYWIAISLTRWAPVIIVAAAAVWFALRSGSEPLEALVAGSIVAMLTRHLLRRSEQGQDRYD